MVTKHKVSFRNPWNWEDVNIAVLSTISRQSDIVQQKTSNNKVSYRNDQCLRAGLSGSIELRNWQDFQSSNQVTALATNVTRLNEEIIKNKHENHHEMTASLKIFDITF